VACCAPMLRAAEPWNALFAHTEAEGEKTVRELRVICKSGQPLLALPGSTRAALACLSLYPAQTIRARLAKRLVEFLIQSRLRPGMQRTRLELSRRAPFTKFLSEVAGEAGGTLPEFGILAGNPRSPGQRFIILICARNSQPSAVVKAGISKEARALIAKETAFLKEVGGRTPGIPALRGQFEDSQTMALALDFFPGESPREIDSVEMSRLLGSWIDVTSKVTIEESGVWQQLKASLAAKTTLAALEPKLQGKQMHPAIFHGDFAPWNIRASPSGDWMVLDWERGDPRGLPGWDWFHFVIQQAILVRKAGVEEYIPLVDTLLSNNAFRAYAQKALIQGFERELLLTYLMHMVEVVRPSEGLEQNRELLTRLNAR
jgi:hypothetical protein